MFQTRNYYTQWSNIHTKCIVNRYIDVYRHIFRAEVYKEEQHTTKLRSVTVDNLTPEWMHLNRKITITNWLYYCNNIGGNGGRKKLGGRKGMLNGESISTKCMTKKFQKGWEEIYLFPRLNFWEGEEERVHSLVPSPNQNNGPRDQLC